MRELRNVLERGVSLQSEWLDLPGVEIGTGTKETHVAPPSIVFDASANVGFKEAKHQLVNNFEREYLRFLIARNQGNLTRAAREAGIDRNYIHRLAKKHGLATK